MSLTEHQALRRAISVVVPCYNEEMNIEPLVSLVGLLGSTNETNKPYPHNGYTARSRLPLTHAPSPAQGIFTRMWHSSDVRR